MSLATKEMAKRYKSRQKAAAAAAPRLVIPGLPVTVGADALQQVQNVGADALHQVEETLDLFSAQSMLAAKSNPSQETFLQLLWRSFDQMSSQSCAIALKGGNPRAGLYPRI